MSRVVRSLDESVDSSDDALSARGPPRQQPPTSFNNQQIIQTQQSQAAHTNIKQTPRSQQIHAHLPSQSSVVKKKGVSKSPLKSSQLPHSSSNNNLQVSSIHQLDSDSDADLSSRSHQSTSSHPSVSSLSPPAARVAASASAAPSRKQTTNKQKQITKQTSKASSNTNIKSSLSPVASTPSLSSASSVPPVDPPSSLSSFDFAAHAHLSSLQSEVIELRSQLTASQHEKEELADALVVLQEELEAAESKPTAEAAKELMKKNRELHNMLNKERGKFLAQIEQLKKSAAAAAPPSPPKQQQPVSPSAAEEAQHALRDMQERYRDAVNKLSDLKTHLKISEDNNKKLFKLLQQEIGNEVPVEQLLQATGKWKGRAQKISLLQGKVRELTKERDDLLSCGVGSSQHKPPPSIADQMQEHNENRIKKVEQERKSELLSLHAQLDAAHQEHSEINKKCESLKARNKILESDVKSLKEKLKLLVSKSDADDALIDELRRNYVQLTQEHSSLKEKHKEQSLMYTRPSSSQSQSASKYSPLNTQLEQVKSQLQALQIEHQSLIQQRQRSFNAEYDAMELRQQVEQLQLQNEQSDKMLSVYMKRCDGLERSLKQLEGVSAAPASNSQRSSKDGKTTLSGRASHSQRDSDELHKLRTQLHSFQSEANTRTQALTNVLANKEEEIAILNNIISEKNFMYNKAIAEIKQQLQHSSSNSSS